jgi:hypothetical protein
VPWALEPESKDSMSYLQDILCDVPGLMEDAMNLQNSELEALEMAAHYQALSKNVLNHCHQLYVWRARWEEENPNSCHNIPAQEHPNKQSLFRTKLYFSSVNQTDQILLYNITLIFLTELSIQVACPIFDFSTPAIYWPPISDCRPLCLPSDAETTHTIAIEICECIGFYFSDYRRFCLLAALRAAYTAFSRTSEQVKWLNTILEKVADLSGLDISKVLYAEEQIDIR